VEFSIEELGISFRRISRMGSAKPNSIKMIHSTETKEIFAALVKAQAEMPTAPKDGNNPHFRSKYATLQSIAETAKPVLKKHGLAITQTFENACDGISIVTTLVHESGQYISGSLYLKAQKNDPQGYGSAITYGRRYAMAAILGMVADEDDDANAASLPPSVQNTRPAPPSGNDPNDNKPWIDGNNQRWKDAIAWVEGEAKAGKGQEAAARAIATLARDFKINKEFRTAMDLTGKGLTANPVGGNNG